MATYVWRFLPVLSAIQFNPDVDVIDFSGSGVSAAEILPFGDDEDILPLFNSARIVYLDIHDPNRLGSANFIGFDDGSVALIGDNAPTRFDDRLSQTLVGGAGNDLIVGGSGNDFMAGGGGNDLFFLVNNHNQWGDQTIDGGAGFDYITSESGDSQISFVGTLNSAAGITVILTQQQFINDQLQNVLTTVGSLKTSNVEGIEGQGGNDSLIGDGNANLLAGQDGNDTLDGGAGNDTLWGGVGNDVLRGGAGDDELRGQAGSDDMTGGLGNDTYIGLRPGNGAGDPGDVVHEAPGEGTNDRVLTATSLALDDYGTMLDNIETIQLVGRAGMTQEQALAKIFSGNLPENLIFINLPELRGDAAANRLVGNDFMNDLNGRAGNDTLDGGGGFDIATFDEDDAASGISITLAESGPTTVLNDGFGTRDTLLNIEGVSGTKFNDSLTGNSFDNLLIGNDGNDVVAGGGGNDSIIEGDGADSIDGGGGSDWVAYFAVDTGVFVNLSNIAFTTTYQSAQVTVAGGTALDGGDTVGSLADGIQYSVDTIQGVENVVGWLFNDTIVGSAGANELRGGAGSDVLYGGLGNDTLDGGDGTQDEAHYDDSVHAGQAINANLKTGTVTIGSEVDTVRNIEVIVGGTGNDTMLGTDGNVVPTGSPRLDGSERFEGGAGNDLIDGGGSTSGFYDIVSYQHAAGGVNVNLGTGLASGADGNDTLSNIDAIWGSAFSDTLTGGSTSTNLDGNQFEFFQGFGGNDTIDGAGGLDRVDYNQSATAVNVDLAAGTATGGFGGSSDTLINIEGVRGSSGADTLTGADSINNFFEGMGGNDLIDGRGGFDSAQYRLSPNGVTVNLSSVTWAGVQAGQATDGFGGTDTLTNIEGVVGSDFGDRFIDAVGANNRYDGGLGVRIDPASTIAGGIGVFQDIVDYSSSDHLNGVIVNLNADDLFISGNPAFTDVTLAGGTALDRGTDSIGSGVDTIANVERVIGTSSADYIRGADLSGTLQGLFTDLNQRFAGGAGNDTIDGGSTSFGDFVNVDYSSSATGVIVNLDTRDHFNGEPMPFGDGQGGQSIFLPFGFPSVAAGTAFDGTSGSGEGQGIDTLMNIDGVIGSSHDDVIFGGSDSRNVWGAKVEVFSPGAGNDTVIGGDGFDFVSYQGQTAAINANLQTGVVFDGLGGTDILSGIDGIRGSQGNDTLTGSNNDSSGVSRQIFEGNAGNDLINGFDGTDLVSYRTSPTGVYVNTGDGFAFDGWMDSTGHEGIDRFAEIEGAQGSDFDDTLIGGALTHGADEWEQFEGRAGNDLIDGNDTLPANGVLGVSFPNEPSNRLDAAEYRSAPSAVIVNMGTSETIVGGHTVAGGTAWDGYGTTDTLVGVEIAVGSSFGDMLIGGNAAHDSMEGFNGLGGDDTFVGGSGQDMLIYEDDIAGVVVNMGSTETIVGGDSVEGGTARDGFGGTDTFTDIEQVIGSRFGDVIIGSDQDNVLIGEDGDDTLRGGIGNDNLIGGDGNDIADYRSASTGVSANLATGLAQDGDGGTDFLVEVEGLRGSSHDDTLVGDDGDNTLHGAGGNDFLDGGAGNDWASYNSASGGVTVDLSTGTASDGLGGTDTLVGIENVRGGDFADSITGDDGNNQLKGGLGNDTLDGGAGTDIAVYNDAPNALTIDLTAGTATDSITGEVDTLISIEGVVGTQFADSIIGNSTGATTREFLNGGGGNDTIVGGGVNVQSILNLSSYKNSSLFIDLTSLEPGSSDGYQGTLTIGSDTITFDNIDGFIGTNFNDSVTGSDAVNDYFRGTAGQDTFDGGIGGFDTLSYRNSPEAVAVNLTGGNIGIPVYADSTGDTIGQNLTLGAGQAIDGFLNDQDNNNNTFNFDQVSNIEAVEGGDGNDSIWGTAGDNRFDGGAGNDFFSGNGGNDMLIGGVGIDRASYSGFGQSGPVAISTGEGGFVTKFASPALDSISGTDTLSSIESFAGTPFNDTMQGSDLVYTGTQRNGGTFELFSGGLGDDFIDGGEGFGTGDGQFDIVDYGFQSSSAVRVDLGADTLSGMGTATGGGGNDTLFNIDMVIGSNFNDTLLGGSASRSYQGQLFEQFRGGAGADTIDGRDGQDRADFQTANAPVYANLGSTALVLTGTPYGNVTIAGGTAIDGTDANSGTPGVQFSRDTLINVEDLRGSNFSDYLAGGGTQNAGTPYDFEVFEGLEGNDTLDGRAGFDLASYSRSDHAVNVDLAAGKAFDGYGTVDKLVSIEGVIGSDFDDTLKGSSADGELFRGGAGNDTIDGGGGLGDAVNYNTSPDAVFVHLGNGVADDGFGTVDTLIGISAVRGSIHDDWLIGSDGNDSLEGLQGNDRLDGGEGFDYAVYTRSDSGVSVDLSSGIALDGAGGNDSLTGIEGVVGSAFNDTMIGDAGDNVFESGGGVDSIDGGDGIDVVTFRNAKAGVVANMATLGGSTLVGGSTIVNVEGVEGSAFNDRLTGDAGPNRLLGGAGLDSLTGGDGDDTLDGGAGVDVLTGGAGNDLYVIDTASDGVIEAIGGGDDTVNASVSYTLGTNVENIVLIGAANINATGNAVANRLFGNSGDNVLDGKAGADTMQGGAGNDTYVVDDVGDQTAESGEGGGIDMVRAGVNWTLDSNIENLTLTGTAALQGTGNALSNLIIGNAAANVIDGRGGDDTMQGGGGNDVYFVDSSADVVTESAGGGIDTVFSVADYTLGAEVENLTFDGSVVTIGNRSGTGNLLANVLTGAQGNDSLVGLAGNDTLDGGTGDDTLVGGLGDDTFIVDSALDVVQENALEGTDTVVASFTYTLGANLDNLVLGGAGNLAGTGNELNNHITGNAGNNTLDGGAGADTLEGGAGNDTYIVNTPNDKIIESSLASGGVDTVLLSADFSAAAAGDVTYVLGNGIENGTVLGSSTVNVTGNASANNLVGNIQNNVLNGGGGNDTLDGLFGADTLVGGTGNDTYTVRYNDPLSPPNPFAVTQIVEIAAASGGIDTAIVSVNNYRLAAGVENMTLVDDPSILVARGNSGNNFIIGNSEHNQLFGDLGNDTLDGGVDADTVTGGNKLYGGAGSDSYIFRNPNDQIIEVGGSAADKALAAVSISLAASAGVENAQALTVQQIADLSHLTVEELLQIDPSVGDIDITGNSLGNNIVGNEGDNILNGGAGVDTLDGGGGNDTYVFALGLDKVNDSGGDNGIDEIQAFFTVSLAAYPTIENLTLLGTDNLAGTGNTKANQITGNSGNNTLDGGAGSDTLIGGDGNDVYVVDNAGDRVRELGTGTDEVRSTVTISIAAAGIVEADSLGNIENVTLLGTAAISATGNDLANVLVGNAGANTLTGGLGDDTLDGGLGADRLVGGAGNDVYVINMLTDVIDESGGGTADEIRSATVLLDLNTRSGIENAMLLGKVGLAIVGDGNANRLEGNDGGNKISGNGGADTLIGNAGNDTLDGGAGDDSMAGGVGNDSYVVDSLSDTVVEASGEGTADTVTTSLSGYTLADEVENLVLVGAGLAGTGNALANRITGTAGADTLDGGAGNDTLTGGAGNDTYLVDAQGDSIIDTAGIDTVIASASYSIAAIASIENLTAAPGSAAINLTGNAAANTLTGNDGNNILDGGAGKDTMHGGAGADIYIVDNVGDVIFDDAGTDIDTVQSKISLNLTLAVGEGGGIVENLVLIGAGNLNATGNGGDNALTGNAGNNILDGGQGADTMTGGAGADTYVVDNVGDVIVESILPAGGVDTVITSLSDYTLLDGFENLTFLGSEAGNGTGNAANNKLVGGATGIQNNLIGLAGNDTLIGGEFADTLDGGTGIDSMVGGAGNDVYFVDALTDKVVDSAGTDEIRASITYSIAALAAIENLTLTVGDINGTGNAGNNVITGSGGANVLSGGAGNDTLLGGGDDDTLLGGAGNDSIDGQGGSDTVSYAGVAAAVTVDLVAGSATGDGTDTLTGVENVIGGNGADSITGDDGDNVLDGGAGADTMRGGAGADTYVVDNIHDVIFDDAGTDIDTVQSKISLDLTLAVGEGGGIVENLVLIGAGNLNATGNGGDNVLTGNAGNNILDGGAGSDTASYAGVSAALFLDLASGKVSGAGLDTLLNIEVVVGGSGSDWVIANSTMPGAYGLDGTGSIYTLSGFDNIRGTLGNDTLTGDNGDNILEGGAGDDSLDGGTGNDTAYYGNETAALTINLTTGEGSGAGDDTLTGMENVVGGTGNDVITGSTADNVLDGGRGVDVLTGGLGDDTFVFDNVGDQAIELADEGTDKVISSVSIAFLADNIENAQLTGAAALNLVANALDNDLVGNAGANHIDAGDGNDTLDGGAGADILTGGKGDDLYFVDNVGDKVVELSAEGNDSVTSSVTYTLAANVENLTLTGSANINATGNADGNILIGNAGNNILDGKLGADTMSGGAGNDTYIVDNIGAQLTENLNEGTDLVKSSVNWTLGANFENLTLLGAAGIGIGNALDNLITGNAVANDLDGGAGNDTMVGLGGNDTYHVDSTGDVLIDSAGIDTVVVQNLDWTLATGFENLALQSLTGHVLTGNAVANAITGDGGADTLVGLAGNDTLDGGSGADSMDGGAGNDTYHVDQVGDVIIESPLASGGIDTVVVHFLGDFTLANGLENLTFVDSEGLGITGTGNAAANRITGYVGLSNDLQGLGGNDTLIGGNLADTLDGGAGVDSMVGGAGDDTYVIDVPTDILVEAAGQGTDTVQSAATYILKVNFENLLLTGTANINGTGNTDSNLITGNTGNNLLFGLGGNDVLNGAGGNDVLDGGTGADSLIGGLGDDRFIFDDAGDTATEAADEGTDTIVSSVSIAALAANVENAQLTGTGALDLTGNALDNNLVGNAGANHIDGGDGNDTLAGGAGSDTLIGGIGDDTFIFDAADTATGAVQGGDGNDTLLVTGALPGGKLDLTAVPNDRYQGIEHIDITGPSGVNNTLKLDVADVQALSDTTNDLVIDGGFFDTVDSQGKGWELQGLTQLPGGDDFYVVYTHTNDVLDIDATLYVNQDMTQLIS